MYTSYNNNNNNNNNNNSNNNNNNNNNNNDKVLNCAFKILNVLTMTKNKNVKNKNLTVQNGYEKLTLESSLKDSEMVGCHLAFLFASLCSI